VKIINILLLFAFLFSSTLFADDYKVYKLYNNKFKVPLPHEPQPQMTGQVQSYYAVDKSKNIMFSIVSSLSGNDYDIGEYKQSVKKSVDDSVTSALKHSGYEIIEFSSELIRQKNIYEAEYTIKFTESGQSGYISTKYIIYKKNIYKWSVIYYDLKQKHIFNNYKKYIELL